MNQAFYIGQRLSFDGQLCTVRYHGELKGTKGEWLGVEWDDPTRGKHAGEHAGTQYFQCLSISPTAASFVRPNRKSDVPRSFVEALKSKYASETLDNADAQGSDSPQSGNGAWWDQTHRPIRISGKEVEEVGFDKIRKQLADLQELRIVILDGLRMSWPAARLSSRATDDTAWPIGLTYISETCPKTIELDLSRNLFEEWREIASICEQLPKLKSLRADGNRFRDTGLTPAERERCLKAFQDIKALRLEETLLTWEQMADIANLFPSLTTLFAASNAYSTLSTHFPPSTLTELSLEDNNFTKLSDLQPLTNLPNLKRLVLKQNRISEITTSGAPLPIFSPSVTDVDLSFNDIATWTFIDKLETVFPGLTSVRVSHNPLYHSLQAADGRPLTAEDGYMLTLARLGNLKVLNFSPISEKERLNSESYYLSLIARELNFSPAQFEAQILASHPRYAYLCSEYSEPVINRNTSTINPNSLAARLIRFTFYLGETAKRALHKDSVDHVEKRFVIEIPRSCTAYTLLGIVGRKIGVSPMRCKLFWETGDWMPALRADDTASEESDSDTDEDEDEDKGEKEKSGEQKVMREVEILPGTRAAGNWVDGSDVVVRIEL